MNIEQLSNLLFPGLKTKVGENWMENNNGLYHLGIDFIVPEGTVVSVPVDCSLVYGINKNDEEWGVKLIFKHLKENRYFMLSHLSDITPKNGQMCFASDGIGIVTKDNLDRAVCHLHIQCFTQEIMDKKLFGEYSEAIKFGINIEHEFPNPLEIT